MIIMHNKIVQRAEMNPAARTIDLLSLLPTVKCISPKLAKEVSTLGRDSRYIYTNVKTVILRFLVYVYRPLPDWNG